jgi:hypothetical protein
VPRRHLSWGGHGFAGAPSGGGDAVEGWWRRLEVAAARVPPVSPEEGDAGESRVLTFGVFGGETTF